MAGAEALVSESIFIKTADQFDADDELIPGSGRREVAGCVIDTAGQSKINEIDVSDGDTTTLRILAPGGSKIFVGQEAEVRGETYVVKHVPFDYAVGRRPALARHRPRVLIIVERKAA